MSNEHKVVIEILAKNGETWIDVTRKVTSWEIDLKESGAYCWDFQIAFADFEFFDLCDPEANEGTWRVRFIFGEVPNHTWYRFLLEDRRENATPGAWQFSITGRALSALWGQGYSLTVSDSESNEPSCAKRYYHLCYEHADCIAAGGTWADGKCTGDLAPLGANPWMDGTCSPTEIIQYLADPEHGFVPENAPAIEWNVEDYTIYRGDYEAANLTPIAIIAELAQAVGAELYPQPNGSVVVDKYYVPNDTAFEIAAEYTDVDDILQLSSQRRTGGRYNAITIIGGRDAEEGGVDGGGIVDVTFKLRKRFTTEAWLEGASVWVGGNYCGLTDENGEIVVPDLVAGKEYDIRATHPDCIDSDQDNLANDFVTVAGV